MSETERTAEEGGCEKPWRWSHKSWEEWSQEKEKEKKEQEEGRKSLVTWGIEQLLHGRTAGTKEKTTEASSSSGEIKWKAWRPKHEGEEEPVENDQDRWEEAQEKANKEWDQWNEQKEKASEESKQRMEERMQQERRTAWHYLELLDKEDVEKWVEQRKEQKRKEREDACMETNCTKQGTKYTWCGECGKYYASAKNILADPKYYGEYQTPSTAASDAGKEGNKGTGNKAWKNGD